MPLVSNPKRSRQHQAIRFVAIHRQMTPGTRGPDRQGWCERSCAVVVTCELQGRRALGFLTESVKQFLAGEGSLSLLPPTCGSS